MNYCPLGHYSLVNSVPLFVNVVLHRTVFSSHYAIYRKMCLHACIWGGGGGGGGQGNRAQNREGRSINRVNVDGYNGKVAQAAMAC